MRKKIILIVTFVFILFIILNNIKLKVDKSVNDSFTLNKTIIEYINNNIDNITTEEELIEFSEKTTCKLLMYSYKQNIDNLSFDMQSKAHCVGYSTVCSQICNYIIWKKQLNMECKHVRGYVYLFNYNVHNFLNFILPNNSKIQQFCKDHDFVLLQTSKKEYHFSPDCYDFLFYDFKSESAI